MGYNLTELPSDIKELKKHAAAIHCMNSLTLLQRKISNALLYHAYRELATKEVHTINIQSLCKILGLNSHNYDAIKDAIRALITTIVEWNVIEENTREEDWTASSVLASVRIKNGVCEYAYSPHLRQLLHSPSVYGYINLIIQSRFKSSYGLALYENCARYRNLPTTKWFSTAEFRKLMGIAEGEYEIFRDFNRRVIKKAVDEVNTYSDLIIEPLYKRVGKRVEEIKFAIVQRPKKFKLASQEFASETDTKNKGDSLPNNEKQILLHRLTNDFGVTQYVADSLISEYAPEYIEEKISLVLTSKKFESGEVEGLAGYLVGAIKNNYLKSKSSKDLISEKHQATLAAQEKKQLEEKNKSKQLELYKRYIEKHFFTFVDTLSESQLLKLTTEWLLSYQQENPANYRFLRKIYDKFCFTHPQTRVEFSRYLSSCEQSGYISPKSAEEFFEKFSTSE